MPTPERCHSHRIKECLTSRIHVFPANRPTLGSLIRHLIHPTLPPLKRLRAGRRTSAQAAGKNARNAQGAQNGEKRTSVEVITHAAFLSQRNGDLVKRLDKTLAIPIVHHDVSSLRPPQLKTWKRSSLFNSQQNRARLIIFPSKTKTLFSF